MDNINTFNKFKKITVSNVDSKFQGLTTEALSGLTDLLNHVIMANFFSLNSNKLSRRAVDLKVSNGSFPLTELVFVYHLVLLDFHLSFKKSLPVLLDFIPMISSLLIKNKCPVTALLNDEDGSDFIRSTSRYKKILADQGFSQIIYTLNPLKIEILPLPKEFDKGFDKPYGYYQEKLFNLLDTPLIKIHEIDIDSRVQSLRVSRKLIPEPEGFKIKLVTKGHGAPFFRTKVATPSFERMEEHYNHTLKRNFKNKE